MYHAMAMLLEHTTEKTAQGTEEEGGKWKQQTTDSNPQSIAVFFVFSSLALISY